MMELSGSSFPPSVRDLMTQWRWVSSRGRVWLLVIVRDRRKLQTDERHSDGRSSASSVGGCGFRLVIRSESLLLAGSCDPSVEPKVGAGIDSWSICLSS